MKDCFILFPVCINELRKLSNIEVELRKPQKKNKKKRKVYCVIIFVGSRDHKIPVSTQVLDATTPLTLDKLIFICSPEFEVLALNLMLEGNFKFPKTVTEARALYDYILMRTD